MDRQYSTLEVINHDEAARAPERDYDATAFELDASASAPQVEVARNLLTKDIGCA